MARKKKSLENKDKVYKEVLDRKKRCRELRERLTSKINTELSEKYHHIITSSDTGDSLNTLLSDELWQTKMVFKK